MSYGMSLFISDEWSVMRMCLKLFSDELNLVIVVDC